MIHTLANYYTSQVTTNLLSQVMIVIWIPSIDKISEGFSSPLSYQLFACSQLMDGQGLSPIVRFQSTSDLPIVIIYVVMNEFSQTSLKGQGLLLLEQGIARVCSIGELVL